MLRPDDLALMCLLIKIVIDVIILLRQWAGVVCIDFEHCQYEQTEMSPAHQSKGIVDVITVVIPDWCFSEFDAKGADEARKVEQEVTTCQAIARERI